MSNSKLKEFIKSIRNCKQAKDERSVVSKESALIRNAFKVSFYSPTFLRYYFPLRIERFLFLNF